jgi:uncharacterized membrane protein
MRGRAADRRPRGNAAAFAASGGLERMIDFIAALGSLALILAYHFFLSLRIKRDPLFTVHALNKLAREAWVDTIMRNEKPDVLAVQTLRNSVMASSFMASTAILLMVGALSTAGAAEHPGSAVHALNLTGATNAQVTAWKLLCLLVDFFVAFFCFAMAVRFYNHVGYLIGIPAQRAQSAISPALVTAYLDRAGVFYLLGMRSFFYSVPLVFWMFGPLFMIVATVVLICALYPLDRAPKAAIASRGTIARDSQTRLTEVAEEITSRRAAERNRP